MVVCKTCGKETEAGKYCGFCGQPLLESNVETNQNQKNIDTIQRTNRIPKHDNYYNTQQFNYQMNRQQNSFQNVNQNTNYHEYYMQGNYQSQYGQQESNINYNYRQQSSVYYPKSQFLGILLSIILPGLGHIYIGKVGEGIILIAAYLFMMLLSYLIVPALIAIAIWLYAIFRTNNMIKKYNYGLPY